MATLVDPGYIHPDYGGVAVSTTFVAEKHGNLAPLVSTTYVAAKDVEPFFMGLQGTSTAAPTPEPLFMIRRNSEWVPIS